MKIGLQATWPLSCIDLINFWRTGISLSVAYLSRGINRAEWIDHADIINHVPEIVVSVTILTIFVVNVKKEEET